MLVAACCQLVGGVTPKSFGHSTLFGGQKPIAADAADPFTIGRVIRCGIACSAERSRPRDSAATDWFGGKNTVTDSDVGSRKASAIGTPSSETSGTTPIEWRFSTETEQARTSSQPSVTSIDIPVGERSSESQRRGVPRTPY